MKREKVVNYVKNKNKKLFEHNFKHFSVFINDPLPDNIDISSTIKELENLFPDHFLKLVDVVYIGNFSFFEKRKINALYSDGALYISNEQDSEDDFKDDFIHELGHAVEEKYQDLLYHDEAIKNEYFGKLKKLKNYIVFEGIPLKNINFFNLSYNKEFDEYLLNDVGYEKLAGFAKNLFLDVYSITSLREYFSTGFEKYFLDNKVYLKSVCPYLYDKIGLLVHDNPEVEHEY